jgi:hypothetical protein
MSNDRYVNNKFLSKIILTSFVKGAIMTSKIMGVGEFYEHKEL